jgi:hypothetical protein
MLSKRDKLIVKIASRLGLFKDEMLGPIANAKQKDPDKALDRLMRDLGLITQTEQRKIARAFNEYIQKKREKSSPQTQNNESRAIQSANSHPEESTYVLGGAKKTESANALASPTENTYVMSENRAPIAHPDAIEGTLVLGQKDLTRQDQEAPTSTERTFVLAENRAPPPSAEMTIVLGNEDAIRVAAPLESDLEVEETCVIPQSNSASPKPSPVTEFEPTFILQESLAPNPKVEEVTEFEQTLVIHEDKEPTVKPGSAVTEFEATLVLRDDGKPKTTIPTPAIPESPDRPKTGWGGPAPTRPKQEQVTEFEPTMVLSEDAEPSPKVESPASEFEATFVLQDEDAVVRRLPDPILDAPAPIDDDFINQPTLLDDSEEKPWPRNSPASPSPAPFPQAQGRAGNPFGQSPDSNLAIPDNIENELTYVLDEQKPAPPPQRMGSTGLAEYEAAPDLTLPKSSEAMDLATPDFSIPDDHQLDLALPDGIDLSPASSMPGGPPSQAKVDSAPEINIDNLTLKSENTGASDHSSAPSPGGGKKGGPLNREVFKKLAKQRRSFKDYRIGDYHIQSEISRGAMGVVLRATPTGMARTMAKARGFDGDVALKVMLENKTDPKEAERFLEEMKILTKLNHPNIVRIFDCGREGGLSYFSMELLEGQDVRNMVTKGGPPPFMLTLKIISQISNALAFLHRSTVYHRDLKPTNVIFDRSVTPFRAVLIDFGLVTNHGSQKDKGLILGTPQYMPPEQAQPRGGFGPVNATSDIYSLGATLYFMLTGRPPFMGRDPRKIIKRVVTEAVRDPVELNKEIPRKLADLCLKCLEKNQRDRYPAARLLAAELEKELKVSQRLLKAKSFLNRFWKS